MLNNTFKMISSHFFIACVYSWFFCVLNALVLVVFFFFVGFLGFFNVGNHVICKQFHFFLSIAFLSVPFSYFAYVLHLFGTPVQCLEIMRTDGLVLSDFRWKVFSLFISQYNVGYRFFRRFFSLIRSRTFSSIPPHTFHMHICWILSSAFLYLLKW